MDHRLASDHTGHLIESGAIIPHRPTLPVKLCGYRCGYGCEEPIDFNSHGGSSDAGTEATYVEYDDPRLTMPEMQHAHDGDRPIHAAQTGIMLLETGSDSQHLSELPDQSDEEYAIFTNSLDFGSHGSRDASRTSSSRGSVQMLTPGPGIGIWAEDGCVQRVNEFPLEYHFLQSPLRLSHQNEHCRGDSLSHMIVPDRPLRAYSLEELWLGQIIRPDTVVLLPTGI